MMTEDRVAAGPPERFAGLVASPDAGKVVVVPDGSGGEEVAS
jgi:hypothetical protein